MADTLKKTLSALRALAGEHRAGAAEIADRAAALLEQYCAREKADDARFPYAMAELAEATIALQPSMAPLINLANRIQLAAESGRDPLAAVRRAVEKFRQQGTQAAAKIARHFHARLRSHATVLTYTYSSTVLSALLAAARKPRAGRGHLERVILSEGRPLYEGRLTAERLAEAGLEVTLVIDAALREHVADADLIVVGADTVFENSYVNKIGTRLLQEQARAANKPFIVLADTAKFLAPALARFHRNDEKPAHEVWRNAPPKVRVLNRYFETIPLQRHVTLLSERGEMPPARVRAWVESLPVARRWAESVVEAHS